MAKAKTAQVLKRDRKKIRNELIAGLEKRCLATLTNIDLVDSYMAFRDRYVEAKTAYDELREDGLSLQDGAVKDAQTVMNGAMEQMTAILAILQTAPSGTRRKEIEEEIREQLAMKGLRGPLFEDRIDTFLKIWDAFQEANRQLNARGRTYFTISSAGKEYEKDNSAAKDLVTMAKAMEDMLDNLGVSVKGYADPEDEEL